MRQNLNVLNVGSFLTIFSYVKVVLIPDVFNACSFLILSVCWAEIFQIKLQVIGFKNLFQHGFNFHTNKQKVIADLNNLDNF